MIAGCAARVDPFADDRALVANASGPPHLTLAVGDPLLLHVVDGILPNEPIETPGPLGMPLRIQPEVVNARLRVRETDACEACVDLEVTANGTAGLSTPLLNAPAIPWRADVGAPLRLDTEQTVNGLRIEAQWGALPVRTTVELAQLPPTIEALASGFISGWLETTLTELLREPAHLVTLDTTGVPLVALKATPGDVIRVDGYIGAPVQIDSESAVPDPGDGWALVVPNETLLALARHNAMREFDKKYYIEPTVLEVDGHTLNAQIRIWRGGRKAHYKSVLVEGVVSIRDGDLWVEPTLADPFASTRWKGGLDTAILTAKLRKWVEKGEVRMDGTLKTPAGEIRLTEISGHGDALVIRGTFEPEAMKSP